MQDVIGNRAEQHIADLPAAFAPADDGQLKGLVVGDFADGLTGRTECEPGVNFKARIF